MNYSKSSIEKVKTVLAEIIQVKDLIGIIADFLCLYKKINAFEKINYDQVVLTWKYNSLGNGYLTFNNFFIRLNNIYFRFKNYTIQFKMNSKTENYLNECIDEFNNYYWPDHDLWITPSAYRDSNTILSTYHMNTSKLDLQMYSYLKINSNPPPNYFLGDCLIEVIGVDPCNASKYKFQLFEIIQVSESYHKQKWSRVHYMEDLNYWQTTFGYVFVPQRLCNLRNDSSFHMNYRSRKICRGCFVTSFLKKH
jgi:hypothetical protein